MALTFSELSKELHEHFRKTKEKVEKEVQLKEAAIENKDFQNSLEQGMMNVALQPQ